MIEKIGIRREDLNKRGEQRVALTPEVVAEWSRKGYEFIVQPAIHPEKKVRKRAFSDNDYNTAGARITEDLTEAEIIFGLKEVNKASLIPEKVYFFFSHTHKGQIKNRPLLKAMVEKKISLIDYELITQQKQRVITAFTYMAGYAGMVDSLWMLGKRWTSKGITNPFEQLSQAVELSYLSKAKEALKEVGKIIQTEGTPSSCPPLITAFLGNGRTSKGAQEMYDLLPSEAISLNELSRIDPLKLDRKKVYKLVLDIPDLFRLKAEWQEQYASLKESEYFNLYFENPAYFEANTDQYFPHCTLLMNCILWSDKYPRILSLDQASDWWEDSVIEGIGDITCDPEGAIQFSRETWIDDPVFVYHPGKRSFGSALEAEGIAVMAVTNLPCEFSADASLAFSKDLNPYLEGIFKADYKAGSLENSLLPIEVKKAVILWKGELTPSYRYMQQYL